MQEFEKQSEIMDMKEEMMSDAIDDAMGDEADEDERYLFYCFHFSDFLHLYWSSILREQSFSRKTVLNTCYTLFGGHSKFLDCISSFIPGIFIEYF